MKTLTNLTLICALALVPLYAQAGDRDEQALALCAAAVQKQYGQDSQIILVQTRRHMHGTQIKLAVKRDADNGYFANCWVGRDETAGTGSGGRPVMVAMTGSSPAPQ